LTAQRTERQEHGLSEFLSTKGETMKFRILSILYGLVFAAVSSAAVAQEKSMIDEVKESGTLRAGVKNDAPHQGVSTEKDQ